MPMATSAPAPALQPQRGNTKTLTVDLPTAFLLSAVLTVASFLGGWYVSDVRDKTHTVDAIADLTTKVNAHAAKLDSIRPSKEMVTQDQFQEFTTWLHADLNAIKSDVNDMKREMKRQR
jgi:hypothetical protein